MKSTNGSSSYDTSRAELILFQDRLGGLEPSSFVSLSATYPGVSNIITPIHDTASSIPLA